MKTKQIQLETLKRLKVIIDKQPINPAYDTGYKARTGIYYAGSLGDAFMKGKQSVMFWINGAIKELEKNK